MTAKSILEEELKQKEEEVRMSMAFKKQVEEAKVKAEKIVKHVRTRSEAEQLHRAEKEALK